VLIDRDFAKLQAEEDSYAENIVDFPYVLTVCYWVCTCCYFDLLLIDGKDGGNHYAFISNFSRLAGPQKNNHQHRLFYCKRCFASFEDRPLKYKLHGKRALAQHRLLCGEHKPVVPLMPKCVV